MKRVLGVLIAMMLLTSVVCVTNAFGAGYTTQPKKIEAKKAVKKNQEKIDEAKKAEAKKAEEKLKEPKKSDERMPVHAAANMKFKLSGKNREMSIKAYAGIGKDLSDSKKSTETTKFKTTNSTKYLTKSQGTDKKKVGVPNKETYR